MAFIEAGLIEALGSIMIEGVFASCEIVLQIFSAIFLIAGKCLPKVYSDRVLALPQLFRSASDFKNETCRHAMREKFFNIYESHLKDLGYSQDTEDTRQMRQSQAEFIRARLIHAMDDQYFKNLLSESEVSFSSQGFRHQGLHQMELGCNSRNN
jgi:hypothetical protein